jgi:8-oxo-dGTP diphosphatase
MTRGQCIIHRGSQILMVKHHMNDDEWWCLPGGGVEPQETPEETVLRELEEECCVRGQIVNQTGHVTDGSGIETITFLVEIGSQEPHMGSDPEFKQDDQILVELRWLTLAEIP